LINNNKRKNWDINRLVTAAIWRPAGVFKLKSSRKSIVCNEFENQYYVVIILLKKGRNIERSR